MFPSLPSIVSSTVSCLSNSAYSRDMLVAVLCSSALHHTNFSNLSSIMRTLLSTLTLCAAFFITTFYTNSNVSTTTLYVHSTKLYVHRMYTICKTYVLVCTSYVHHIYIECTSNVHRIFIVSTCTYIVCTRTRMYCTCCNLEPLVKLHLVPERGQQLTK